jgi:mono/diheme cytochrome c family protein
MRRSAAFVLVVALFALSIALILGQQRGADALAAPAIARLDPQVAMGAHLFVQFACSACHGAQGRGGVSPDVPALRPIDKAPTVAQLTKIIDHGLLESKNPKKPYMPVWGPVISKSQVADLLAYVRAGLPKVVTPIRCPSRATRARRSPALRFGGARVRAGSWRGAGARSGAADRSGVAAGTSRS